MKKWVIILILVSIIIPNMVSSTPSSDDERCYELPNLVYEFKNYYEDVFIDDSCNPSYSFVTPSSYSKLGFKYYGNDLQVEIKDRDIEEYDTFIRKSISVVENCPGYEVYHDLEIKTQFSNIDGEDSIKGISLLIDKVDLRYFVNNDVYEIGENISICKDISKYIESRRFYKEIANFLEGNKFGDYRDCVLYSKSHSSNTEKTELTIGLSCDGVRERMSLYREDEVIIEAFFLDHINEPYRKVYPEDIKLKRRSTVWQNQIINFIIDYIFIILLILISIVVLIIFIRKRRVNKNDILS
jgi:hypothetical protein